MLYFKMMTTYVLGGHLNAICDCGICNMYEYDTTGRLSLNLEKVSGLRIKDQLKRSTKKINYTDQL